VIEHAVAYSDLAYEAHEEQGGERGRERDPYQ
jgi:hypothetical protein